MPAIAADERMNMEKAKVTTETVSATIKKEGKTIVDGIVVELNTTESSPAHKVLHGSFKVEFDRSLVPSFYQLILEDGRFHRIIVSGVRPQADQTLVDFLVVAEN